MIYDGGSNDDLARGPANRMLASLRAVAPTLTTINHLILSHPHRDHVELLPDLFGAYQIAQVWDSGRVNDVCGYRALLTAVRDEPNVAYHNALQDFGTRDYPCAAKTRYGEELPATTLHLLQASRITESQSQTNARRFSKCSPNWRMALLRRGVHLLLPLPRLVNAAPCLLRRARPSVRE